MLTNIDRLAMLAPCFAVSQDGFVIETNEQFEQQFERVIADTRIKDVFKKWETIQNGTIIRAQTAKRVFYFLPISLANNQTLYVSVPSLAETFEELTDLRNLNLDLETVIENSYDGIYITDREGQTLKVNSAIERITGIPKEYYIGRNVEDLVARGILSKSVTRKVVEKKRSISFVHVNKKGRETLLTGNPILNPEGEVERVVTNIRDLTDLKEMQEAVQEANALNQSYRKEIERLKKNVVERGENQPIINSEDMKLLYEMANRIVNVDATVLLLGETGVGKDVLANYIYNHSLRREKGKFVKVNCGAIPPDLLESELFGYDEGAFTGAKKQGKPGMFEIADKGVLFLDEIGELPLDLQVKLLRVIQEQEIQRVGGTTSKKIDVRLIAATNRDLKQMVEAGEFREDLYYRLNVIPISIPPLRKRRDEILPLSYMHLEEMNKKYGTLKKLNGQLKAFLYHYKWPGNVRELFNLLERIVLLNEDDVLGLEHLPAEYKIDQPNNYNEVTKETSQMTLKEVVEQAERKLLEAAVQKYDTTYEIARMLKTSQPTIVRRLEKYNIQQTTE